MEGLHPPRKGSEILSQVILASSQQSNGHITLELREHWAPLPPTPTQATGLSITTQAPHLIMMVEPLSSCTRKARTAAFCWGGWAWKGWVRRLSQKAGSTLYAMRKQRSISDTLSLVSGISDTFSPKIFRDYLEESIMGMRRARGQLKLGAPGRELQG